MRSSIVMLWGIVFAATGLVCAAPEPAVVPGPDDWTLDVRFEHFQPIAMKVAGENGAKVFWYMILTLTNESGQDVDFYPQFELMTDTLQVVPAGIYVPGGVFSQIKKRYKHRYPLLQPIEQAGHKMLQGEDNAKDAAIMWPDFDNKAKKVSIFITGLSNETAAVEHPTEKDEEGSPVKIYLRKTLQLNYAVSGDPAKRQDLKVTFIDKQWVMR